jgi:hypothetical protein
MTPATVAIAKTAPTSRPFLALGLTFLLLGLGFASPFRLAPHPPEHIWQGAISIEALNLYALVAFAGWSHFIYAWRGQWKATQRLTTRSRFTYWVSVTIMLFGLMALLKWLGVAVFSLTVWVYNISHFVRAEIFFSGTRETRAAFYSPVAAFAWFTLCLFQVGPLRDIRIVFACTVLLAAVILVAGGWRLLASGEVRLPLLTLFLLGETLVWCSYSPYMSEAFRVGIYIFHIGAASFYHYLSAYFYAESGNYPRKDRLLGPIAILIINIAIISAGAAVAWLPALRWLQPILGVEWFTLWVALHLVASDFFPYWKQRSLRQLAA